VEEKEFVACLEDGAESVAASKVGVGEDGGGGLQHGNIDEEPLLVPCPDAPAPSSSFPADRSIKP
jgi:hypothetical protein